MLALGTDLTSLGMNLSSAEPLFPLFASPWADVSVVDDDVSIVFDSFYSVFWLCV
jgi:hypothetical protein